MEKKNSQKKIEISDPSVKKKPTKAKFPIVGIGASAGGLEALEQFFSNMPSDTGMAFVVFQHLDPIWVKNAHLPRRICNYVFYDLEFAIWAKAFRLYMSILITPG